jgi:hypothetical protein
MISLDLGSMVKNCITKSPDIVRVKLLPVFVIQNLFQGHVLFIFDRKPILIDIDWQIKVFGVILPAVYEQVAESPPDYLEYLSA